MEISIEESLEVAESTLVGRARGKKFTSEFIQSWGEQVFVSDNPLRFEAQCLAKGWFMFRFEDKKDAEWVLERNWSIGNIPVLMKHWSPLFNALKERTDEFPVWVRAPGLLSFLWTENVFRTIGNTVGSFLEADMSFLKTKNRAMARILVSLNPGGGLPQKVNLQYKEYVFEQILDYEHLPFRCHTCHEYGHLAKDCPRFRRRRIFRRTPVTSEQAFYRVPPPQEKAVNASQEVEELEMEENVKEAEVEEPQLHEATQINDSQPADAVVEITKDAVADLQSDSAQDKGMCSGFPSISLQIPEHISISVKNTPSSFPLHNLDQNDKVEVPKIMSDIDSISVALPSLDLNSEEKWPPLASPSNHNPFPYNLRSMGGESGLPVTAGGLGQSLGFSSAKNKRGRKSDLSKAKLKANIDVADGNQYSIPGVLRAVQTPDQVIK